MIPHALEGGYKVTSWMYDGFWAEIGSLKSFYDINLALAMPDAPLSVDAIHRGILSRGAAPPAIPFDCNIHLYFLRRSQEPLRHAALRYASGRLSVVSGMPTQNRA